MMYHSVIKKYRYHIRRNVYQLYKIRRHGMACHPGALRFVLPKVSVSFY